MTLVTGSGLAIMVPGGRQGSSDCGTDDEGNQIAPITYGGITSCHWKPIDLFTRALCSQLSWGYADEFPEDMPRAWENAAFGGEGGGPFPPNPLPCRMESAGGIGSFVLATNGQHFPCVPGFTDQELLYGAGDAEPPLVGLPESGSSLSISAGGGVVAGTWDASGSNLGPPENGYGDGAAWRAGFLNVLLAPIDFYGSIDFPGSGVETAPGGDFGDTPGSWGSRAVEMGVGIAIGDLTLVFTRGGSYDEVAAFTWEPHNYVAWRIGAGPPGGAFTDIGPDAVSVFYRGRIDAAGLLSFKMWLSTDSEGGWDIEGYAVGMLAASASIGFGGHPFSEDAFNQSVEDWGNGDIAATVDAVISATLQLSGYCVAGRNNDHARQEISLTEPPTFLAESTVETEVWWRVKWGGIDRAPGLGEYAVFDANVGYGSGWQIVVLGNASVFVSLNGEVDAVLPLTADTWYYVRLHMRRDWASGHHPHEPISELWIWPEGGTMPAAPTLVGSGPSPPGEHVFPDLVMGADLLWVTNTTWRVDYKDIMIWDLTLDMDEDTGEIGAPPPVAIASGSPS